VTEPKPRPFDERAALDELERLAEKIQSTRRQRERAVAEFNAFVKTFKDEDHATRQAALQPVARNEVTVPPRPPVAPMAPTIERRATEPTPPPPAPTPTPTPEAPVTIAADTGAEPIAWTASKSKSTSPDLAALLATPRSRIGLAAAGLLVVLLLVSWLVSQSGDATPENEPAAAPAAQTPPASTSAPASAPATAPPSTPKPVASTGVPRALTVVLMTSRPVWTRVIVDDRKVIERELPGSQTIPLGADRAIAIRAGDAGAIRLVVDGKDIGVMGRDGQIGSRAFTAGAR
jgi:hypothetical protein